MSYFEKSSLWVTDEHGAKEDAEMLYIALQEISVDPEVLTDVVVRRCRRHRQQVIVQYYKLFDQDLEGALLNRMAGEICRGLIAALTPRYIMLACQARISIYYNDIITLLEMFCDIDKKLYERVAKYCRFVSEADEPMDMFIYIRYLISKFEKQGMCHIEETIYNEFSGYMQYALITIVNMIQDRPSFVAKQIYDCVLRTAPGSSGRLIRLIVTQTEHDLRLVKRAFQEIYGVSIANFLKGEVEETFSHLLVALSNAEAIDLEEE